MTPEEYRKKEEQQRAQSWYAILGLGALIAAAIFILRWIPNNPFYAPSELPNTTRYNAEALQGRRGPLVPVSSGAQSSIGPGCQPNDVALAQEHRGPLHRTAVQALLAREERARARGQRFIVMGWSARPPDAGDGCVVEFVWQEHRTRFSATWLISGDRQVVEPLNEQARRLEL